MSRGLGPAKYTNQVLALKRPNVGDGWCLHSSRGVCSNRASLMPSAGKGTSPEAASPYVGSTAPDTPLPRIPEAVQRRLCAARRSWLDRCLEAPLVDPATNSRVHVYGNVHFAPFGGPDGLAELQELLERVQPTVLAIEQPFDLGARTGLPYPEVIHQLIGLIPGDVLHLVGPCNDPVPDDPALALLSKQSGTTAATGTADAGASKEMKRLRSLLPGLAQPARVGRDLLDPFEVFGLYAGCDYVTRPSQLLEASSLFGHLPGLEYAALVEAAQQRGVQVCSVDAPLRLQEKWTAQLVADFKLKEADLARRLQHDLARAQSFLPIEYFDWDVSLAETLRRIESESAEAQRLADRGSGVFGGGGPGQLSPSTVTAFKVSRAVAAATVPVEASKEAFALQAALQPLKFAFFARRASHLVLQVRDLCQRMSMRRIRVDAGNFRSVKASAGQGGQTEPSGSNTNTRGGSRGGEMASEQVALVDVSDQPQVVVLAVVGRQYITFIEELWANERSVLWHGDVPRTFAASALEHWGRS